MDLQFAIDRLKARTTGMRAIGSAADLDAAFSGVVAVPSLFVIPLSDDSTPVDDNGPYEEWLTSLFGVVMAVSNAKDTRGDAALATLVPVRQQVKAALAGWVPDEATGEPVTPKSGRLLRFDGDGRLWWIDQFAVKTFFESTP